MASYRFGLVWVAASSAVLGAGVAGASSAERPPATEIRAFLDGNGSPPPLWETPEGRAVWSVTQAFYRAREHQPAWLDDDGQPTGTGRPLVQVLDRAGRDGLDATALGLVSSHGSAPDDVRWTVAFLQYASVLGQGAVGPASVPFWRPVRRGVDLAALLRRAVDGDAEDALDSVRPWHPQHARLAAALARYRALAARETGTLVLPGRLRLRPGQKSDVVPRLRERLALEGDLADDAAAAGDVFDPTLAAGLRRFEARLGLAADGRLDADVAAALSVPLAERVRQIELNLERWRWAPPSGVGRSILVNIPTFTLHAYDDGREALRMRVITGQSDTPTPVFSQDMTMVVFRPYWNVPVNIASSETLPAVLRDLGFLARNGLEVVVDGRVVDPARVNWRRSLWNVGFRQRPGAGNPLGLVKFLFPNPFNIDLHDTPSDGLFLRPRRTLSHGCVRLEKPEELARWVLDGRPWSPRAIAAAMRSGRERGVPLEKPIPITIGYFTAWVDDEGVVRFLPDVYRHDVSQKGLVANVGGPP